MVIGRNILGLGGSALIFIGAHLPQYSFIGGDETLSGENELFGGVGVRIGLEGLGDLNEVLFIGFLAAFVGEGGIFMRGGMALGLLVLGLMGLFGFHDIKLLLKIITAI